MPRGRRVGRIRVCPATHERPPLTGARIRAISAAAAAVREILLGFTPAAATKKGLLPECRQTEPWYGEPAPSAQLGIRAAPDALPPVRNSTSAGQRVSSCRSPARVMYRTCLRFRTVGRRLTAGAAETGVPVATGVQRCPLLLARSLRLVFSAPFLDGTIIDRDSGCRPQEFRLRPRATFGRR